VLLVRLRLTAVVGRQYLPLTPFQKITSEHDINQEINEIIVNASPATFRLTGSIIELRDITSAQFSGRFGVITTHQRR
jgi:hypothetical protein